MRAQFAKLLYAKMKENPDIFVLTGDLGYGMWDAIQTEFPDRFFNVGAAEQALLDIGVGLALSGKIPILYSITSFLLFRGFETLRTYVNHEEIRVKLVGSGRNKDYELDGFSHNAEDDIIFLEHLPNIKIYHPTMKNFEEQFQFFLGENTPSYMNLTRG